VTIESREAGFRKAVEGATLALVALERLCEKQETNLSCRDLNEIITTWGLFRYSMGVAVGIQYGGDVEQGALHELAKRGADVRSALSETMGSWL
jgi:hypothetical protein